MQGSPVKETECHLLTRDNTIKALGGLRMRHVHEIEKDRATC